MSNCKNSSTTNESVIRSDWCKLFQSDWQYNQLEDWLGGNVEVEGGGQNNEPEQCA